MSLRIRLALIASVATAAIIVIGGCGKQQTTAPLGSERNPIKMALVPSLDTQKLVKDGRRLAALMERETGLKYELSVPISYAAVVSAMGTEKVDVGWLSPLPYVIAHDQYQVKVILTTVRDNSTKYWSAIIVRTDSGITKLEDLEGKRFAYGDPVSTSGCLYAKDLIRSKGYDPIKFFSNVIYAGAHDRVVMAVYNRQVDGGAIYGGPKSDAREKVINTYPDVLEKTRVIARSADIPNDTVSVRKDLPAGITRKVADALVKIARSEAGRKVLLDVYGIDGFVPAKDSDYDSVRRVARAEKIKLENVK